MDGFMNSAEFDSLDFDSLDTAKVKLPTGKHTQGTWRLEKQVEGQFFTAIGGPIAIVGGEHNAERDKYVVGVCSDFGPHGPVQTEANARLITAAPDLLAACEKLLRHVTDGTIMCGIVAGMNLDKTKDEARAAIAMAKGESK